MSDARSRDALLGSLIRPVRPRDPELAARFEDLDPDRRRAVARAATNLEAAEADPDPELVLGLAETYATRLVPPMLAGLGLAVLVLMTVWGFGRSAFPEQAPAFLLVGGVAGLVSLQLTGRRMILRAARARQVHAALSGKLGPRR